MKLDVTDCEVLGLDSGVIDCPITAEKVPVLFMTVRITGQPAPVNLAIRNPKQLKYDVPLVIRRSTVLNGGKFVPELRLLDWLGVEQRRVRGCPLQRCDAGALGLSRSSHGVRQ